MNLVERLKHVLDGGAVTQNQAHPLYVKINGVRFWWFYKDTHMAHSKVARGDLFYTDEDGFQPYTPSQTEDEKRREFVETFEKIVYEQSGWKPVANYLFDTFEVKK